MAPSRYSSPGSSFKRRGVGCAAAQGGNFEAWNLTFLWNLRLGIWSFLRLLLLQFGQHAWIADVHPSALNFQTRQLVAGYQQPVNGVRQLVFAARGFLEPGSEFVK